MKWCERECLLDSILTCSPGSTWARSYTAAASLSSSSVDQVPRLQRSLRSLQRSLTEAADLPRCAAMACQLLPCFIWSSLSLLTSSDEYFPMWLWLSYSLYKGTLCILYLLKWFYSFLYCAMTLQPTELIQGAVGSHELFLSFLN